MCCRPRRCCCQCVCRCWERLGPQQPDEKEIAKRVEELRKLLEKSKQDADV